MDELASRPARGPRHAAILDVLATEGRLGVADAAGRLGVSEATIRRDFAELARRQLVNRTHGGVTATSVAYELPYRYRSSQRSDELTLLAAAAAALVEPGQVVGLNGGTTTTAVARALTARSELVQAPAPLTLVTSALNIATEAVLRPHVRCVTLGGIPRPESYEVTGPLALLALEQVWLDVLILGVDGISARQGATCRYDDEAAVSRRMAERAERVVVVGAAAKVGRRALASICPPSRVDDLVTDPSAEADELERLRGHGVRVHLA